MINTPYVRDCIIHPEKTALIRDAIAQGTSQYGMQTFDQSLHHLFEQGLITYDEAINGASNVDEFFQVRVAGLLRQSGLRVMVYPDADKIGRQIKYADSLGIPFVAILGSNEIAAAQVTVKNLKTQTQATYDQAAAGGAILEGLRQRG